MIGGLGGLGGFDPGNALGAIGMALLSSPRDNPLQNLPQFIGEANKNAERAYQVKAMEEALVAAGLPRAEAQVMARSPEAAKVRLQTLQQQKGEAAHKNFLNTIRDSYGEGGSAPAATPGPRSDIPAGGVAASGDREEVRQYVRQAAAARGIDPDVAERVVRQESGFNPGAIGDKGKSFGVMQLYTGGGLGNVAQKQGIDLSPANWRQHVDFGLDVVAKDGWRQWYGARDVGIGRWDGIRQRQAEAPSASAAPAQAPAPAPDWRTAQDSPETFAAKLAQARGGSAGLSIAPAAPPAEPVPAPAAPTMPATAPLPPARPAGLGAAPPVPTMGLPPPGVDPHAGDAGAKAFAASGMGRPAPVLTPPAPMALAGQATAPARVTSPVAPLPAPPPAPPPPPPRAADLPVENAVPAQGPAPAPQTQAPTEPRAIAAERKLETVVQSGPTRLPSEYQGKTQSSLAQQHFQKALKLEMAASTPNLPENSAKAARELAKYHFDVAKEYLKPSELDRQIDRLNVPEEQKQALRLAAADKRPDVQRNAEFAYPDNPQAQREAVGRAMPDTRPEAERRARIAIAEPQVGEEMIRQSRATSAAPDDIETKARLESVTGFLGEIAKEGPKIAQRSADLDILTRVVSKTPTGAGANVRAFLDRVGRELGFSDGTLASQQDAVKAITNRIAPTLRQPGSGAQSDAELSGFLASLPSLTATPGGNQLIAATLQRAAAIDRQRADIASQWQAGRIKAAEARERIAELDRMSIYANAEEKAAVEVLIGGKPLSGNAKEQKGWRVLGVE